MMVSSWWGSGDGGDSGGGGGGTALSIPAQDPLPPPSSLQYKLKQINDEIEATQSTLN
jgi:hypothetical protein